MLVLWYRARVSDQRVPPPTTDEDERDPELITAPIAEIEREERRAFLAQHRTLFIVVAAVAFSLVLVAGSIGFLVGRGGDEPELVTVSDGSDPAAASDELQPVASEELLASFFSGVIEEPGSPRSAVTLRFGDAEVEGRGWLQADYVMNTLSSRERGVALLQPSAKLLLLGSGEGFEVGRDAGGVLLIRGGEGRRVRMSSESP